MCVIYHFPEYPSASKIDVLSSDTHMEGDDSGNFNRLRCERYSLNAYRPPRESLSTWRSFSYGNLGQ